jgi:membrane protease YdiL (CAAX protease family)
VADTEERPRRDELMPAHAGTATSSTLRQGWLLVALNVSWGLVMARFGHGDIYWVIGLHAMLVLAIVLALPAAMLRVTLRPRRSDVVLGLVAGVAMTVATYAVFDVARALEPSLATRVARLYRAAGTETPSVALAWVLVILTSEELLWRGAWIDVWSTRLGIATAAVTSVLAFAITQVGSGSIIVVLLAAVCGTIWTALRLHTGRVVASLIAHAIWTPVVILWNPVL